uniref:Profilin n=1 Tax=Tetrahymena pyriformis TaxID=5908 RepID=PROF_TETPY|nr:RecName: Full=Profilin [Tetrahymena pyriformis]BAA00694.1 profilin [Tetrahymena pyriformis]
MSGWDQYVQYLTANQQVEYGLILGKTDGTIWASNVGLTTLYNNYQIDVEGQKANVNETANLLAAMNNNGVPTDPLCGIRIMNQKYYTVKYDADSQVWYLKKDHGGACIAITNQALVIGTFDITKKQQNGVAQNPGQVNKVVESLAATLKQAGY